MQAIDAYRRMLAFTERFVFPMLEDMRDAPFTQPTPRGGNHPLWIAGHLACSERAICAMITGEPTGLEHWDELFGPYSEPTTDASKYPPFDDLLAAFRDARADTMRLLDRMDDKDVDRPLEAPPEGMEDVFRTAADALGLIVIHQEHHMGQLADARRAAGRRPLFV